MTLRILAADRRSETVRVECARSHRFTGLEIGFDKPAKDFAASIRHVAKGRSWWQVGHVIILITRNLGSGAREVNEP